ncbi:MAG TPA: sigma-70 family RNA polymerase sigma factor, partial [Tangfeifania sp.]|nr:sigma-70 family RNA polymerase sigma factor [Tangfeifania sp.]
MAENLNQHIFKRLQNGDEKALNELFDLYYSALYLFANKYLQDMDLARSLVQQVFIDLWTKRERITVSTSVKSYLYTTVKNRCIDVLRKTKATSEISESVEN